MSAQANGGNFWRGAAHGGILTAFNHEAHEDKGPLNAEWEDPMDPTRATLGLLEMFGIGRGIQAGGALYRGMIDRLASVVRSIMGKGAVKRGATVAENAASISKQVGKNSISIRTPNKTLHFDLQGAPHKGVPTPHIQQSLRNVNPKTGQVFWNKDRLWVQPMTQQDIRIIRNYLKRQ